MAEKDAVAVNARKGSKSRPHGLQYRSHHDKCGSEPRQLNSAVKERTASIDSSSNDDDSIRPPKIKVKVSLHKFYIKAKANKP